MKKKIGIIISIIVILSIALAAVLYYINRFDLKINGQTVEKEEYLYVMNQQVYDVTKELATANGKQVDQEFWTEEVDGVLPYEELADQTVEQLKYNRAVYENAKEQGYVDEVDYAHLLERMEKENESRAKKIAAGEAVYGLSEFSVQSFMEYEMDTFQKSYCEDLDNEGMEITAEEQEAYYEEYKETLFVKNDDLTLDYIKVEYAAEGMDDAAVKEIKDALTQVYKEVDGQHSLSELAQASDLLKTYLSHEEILSSEVAAQSKVIGDILTYAYELEKGDTTQVIDENGTLYLIQCTDKVDYDYLPLEDVKDNINKELRERHYDELMEQRAKESTVDGDMKQVYTFTQKSINK